MVVLTLLEDDDVESKGKFDQNCLDQKGNSLLLTLCY